MRQYIVDFIAMCREIGFCFSDFIGRRYFLRPPTAIRDAALALFVFELIYLFFVISRS